MEGTAPVYAERQRQHLLDLVTDRWSKDQIEMEEYEKLVERIQGAHSGTELDELQKMLEPTQASNTINTVFTLSGSGETQTSVALLSERRLSGDWLRQNRVSGFCALASIVYDFRAVRMPSEPVVLDAVALLGSVEIIVPPDLAVRMDAVPIAGEATLKRGVSSREEVGKPLLIITGAAVLGSISVRVK